MSDELIFDRWSFSMTAQRLFAIDEWPRWLRRAFLLTLPISGPIFAAMFLAFCFLLCGAIAADIGRYFLKLWQQP